MFDALRGQKRSKYSMSSAMMVGVFCPMMFVVTKPTCETRLVSQTGTWIIAAFAVR